MRLTYLFLLLVLHSCQNKQNGETEKTKLETLTLTDTLKVELLNSEIPNTTNLNSENIAIDSAEVPLGSLTILDFVQNGLNRLVKTNDSLFIEFLTSFTTYQTIQTTSFTTALNMKYITHWLIHKMMLSLQKRLNFEIV